MENNPNESNENDFKPFIEFCKIHDSLSEREAYEMFAEFFKYIPFDEMSEELINEIRDENLKLIWAKIWLDDVLARFEK